MGSSRGLEVLLARLYRSVIRQYLLREAVICFMSKALIFTRPVAGCL